MLILNNIVKAVEAYRDYVERANALKQLKQLSPRELADIGIEPYELEMGVIGFPWKSKDAVSDEQVAAPVQPIGTKPANNFANTMITLYSAWGRPVRNWYETDTEY